MVEAPLGTLVSPMAALIGALEVWSSRDVEVLNTPVMGPLEVLSVACSACRLCNRGSVRVLRVV